MMTHPPGFNPHIQLEGYDPNLPSADSSGNLNPTLNPDPVIENFKEAVERGNFDEDIYRSNEPSKLYLVTLTFVVRAPDPVRAVINAGEDGPPNSISAQEVESE